MLKVLEATKETQGQRASDFTGVPEGELVRFHFQCDSDTEPDGGCGCARSMTGMQTLKATTTFKVAEIEMGVDEYIHVTRESYLKSGFPDSANRVIKWSLEVISFCLDLDPGVIVELRGDLQLRTRLGKAVR